MSRYANATVDEKTGEIFSPKGRLVYPELLTARPNRKIPDSKPKFGALLLIPKTADVSAIKNAIEEAARAEHGKDWKNKKLRLPLVKTTDEPKLAEYAEDYPYVLKASANQDFPPVVFGPNAKPFSGDRSDIYGGRWAVIAGGAWGYSTGSSGVGWNLNRVQLLDHDEPIGGGRVTSSDGFEALAEESPAAKSGEPKSADDIW